MGASNTALAVFLASFLKNKLRNNEIEENMIIPLEKLNV